MRPNSTARPEYVAAFREIAERIAKPLSGLPKETLPIKMYVAGGAALHFYTGERVSKDIDAVFSHRIVLPDNLEVSYRDADSAARLLYFDRQYNDSFALKHEDAYDDSIPLTLKNMDPHILDIRLLSALDLAVSKISRFSNQDREDITSLAKHGLIGSAALRRRAEDAATAYVGNVDSLQGSIKLACRIVEDVERRSMRSGQ
jgi:Nucleotidyltransferase of unknown function (DUF6036)